MSPIARKPRRKKGEPFEVKQQDGDRVMTVSATGKGDEARIIVTWFCGDVVQFEVELLRSYIELSDDFSAPDGSWLNLDDVHRKQFWTRIEGGVLTAEGAPQDGYKVAWPDLKRALQAAIAEVTS